MAFTHTPVQSFTLGALLLITAGCVADSGYDSTEWAIVGGERTSMDEPAVVAVLNRFGGLCTGTLIASRVVLTAKHCVQGSGAPGPVDPSNLIIGVGDDVNRLSRYFTGSSVWTTPGVYRDDGRLSGLVGVDVALITLPGDTGIAPIRVHRGSANERIGDPVRVVGFGEVPSGGAGIKYRVMSRISGVQGAVLSTPPSTCQGDSGGPLILTVDGEDEVVGVTSFGSGACGAGGFNGYNRIDFFMSDIDRVLEEAGVCVPMGAELCNGADDNCDGEVDEGCLEVGETCSRNEECSSERCEDTGGVSRCTTSCDPLRPNVGCPADMYCSQTSGCDGRCVGGTAGAAGNGETCVVDTDCASLFCASLLGESRCLSPCRGGEGQCFYREDCAAPEGSCGVCTDDAVFAEPAGIGERCRTNEGCASGSCLTDLADPYCSASCADDGDCPRAFHCRTDESVCVRGRRASVGQGCLTNGDCGAGLFCATRGDEQWCTRFCDSGDGMCPDGFDCSPVGEQSICTPQLAPTGIACAADTDCGTNLCRPVGLGGATLCTRRCDPDSVCEPGFVCVRQGTANEGLCIAEASESVPTVPPGDDGGCSVGLGQKNSGKGSSLAALFALGLLARRRRRR